SEDRNSGIGVSRQVRGVTVARARLTCALLVTRCRFQGIEGVARESVLRDGRGRELEVGHDLAKHGRGIHAELHLEDGKAWNHRYALPIDEHTSSVGLGRQ